MFGLLVIGTGWAVMRPITSSSTEYLAKFDFVGNRYACEYEADRLDLTIISEGGEWCA